MNAIMWKMRWILTALAVGLTLGSATADTISWTGGGGEDRNWTNAANWNASAPPTAGDHAYFAQSFSRAVVTQPGAVCFRLHLARVSGTTASLEILSGDLTAGAGQQSDWGHNGGQAIVTVRGGSLTDGNVQANDCVVTQEAGRVTLTGIFAQAAGSDFRYVLQGGELYAPSLIANAGSATIIQTGGTNTLRFTTTYLAKGVGGGSPIYSSCYYALNGGVLNLSGGTAVFGGGGAGQFGSGILHLSGGSVISTNSGSLTIRGQGGAYGRIKGWGTFEGLETLTMNGQTISDGEGADRTLAVTFDSLANGIVNGAEGTNGWYAVEGGKLELPPIPVAGDGEKVWGDTSAAALDLVNAVAFVFSGVTGSGVLKGALCAEGRSDVPGRANASKIIGLWRFEHDGFACDAFNVTLRYDHEAAAELDIEKEELQLFSHNGMPGGKWVPVESVVNTETRTITAVGLASSMYYLAVGLEVESTPKGTVLLVR